MASVSIAASTALAVHLLCALGLVAGYWLARHFYTSTLVADPARVLRLLLTVQSPVVIVAYSLVRLDRERTSFLKAVGRGLLGLPIGALVNAFGAIVLGAPIWIDLSQQFVFMALQGMNGSAYCLFPKLRVLLITWLACQDMELSLVHGLGLGQCHLIGKGPGRNGQSVLLMVRFLATCSDCWHQCCSFLGERLMKKEINCCRTSDFMEQSSLESLL